MVILDPHEPGVQRDAARAHADVAFGGNLLRALVTPEDIRPGIRGVLENVEHAVVVQPTPDESAVPRPAVGALREPQLLSAEVVHDRVGAARLAEDLEDQPDSALDLLVRIEHDAPLVGVAQADRQREAELTLLGLVELAALEARANDVQLGLGDGGLEAQQQRVVEVRRVVAAVLVDDQRPGQRADLDQPMPFQVRAGQP